MDDSKIVELYLLRDEDAIQQTAMKYGKRLRSISYGIVQDQQAAEECESDTYIQAWNTIPPNEPRTYFYPYLARIIRHISLNCCRDRNRMKRGAYICELSAELEQCLPCPDDMQCKMDDMVIRELLNGFLGELDADKRYIFIRRYWYLDSIAEISKRCCISQSKVKTTLFRCRNQLRERLIKEGYSL